MEQEINRHKYPRTFHLPWSEGKTDDDKTLPNVDHFVGEMVVVTEKLDGENTSLYSDGYVHARSMDAAYHGSREWIRADWGGKYWDLPETYRICGENCFAVHSIKYDDLESYFYGFSVWEGDTCLDWEETTYILESFNYPTPRVLYHGVWDEEQFRA